MMFGFEVRKALIYFWQRIFILPIALLACVADAGTCGGVTHPNVFVNPDGDYGLVPTSYTAVCQIQTAGVGDGFMEQNLSLNSQTLWVLKGRVEVGVSRQNGAQFPITDPNGDDAAILTLAAGTTVVGNYDSAVPTSDLDYLIFHRGSRIEANGTEGSPIRFTSLQAVTGGVTASGQWGGLIINGYASINDCSNGTVVLDCEASGDFGAGQYGGNDDNDTSGTLRFVVVENAGFEVQPGTTFDGLSLQGVGAGTTLDHLQVIRSGGVGLGIAGGAANLSHIILNQNGGGLAWDNGWRGSLQFLLVDQTLQDIPAIRGSNHTLQAAAFPQSAPSLANLTLLGDANSEVVALENGTGVNLLAAVISDPNGTCFSHTAIAETDLTASHSRVACNAIGSSTAIADWYAAGQYNSSTAGVDLNGYINGQSLSQAITVGLPTFPDITHEQFIGAVGYCGDDWAGAWAMALPTLDPGLCLEPAVNVPMLGPLGMAGLSALLAGLGCRACS